MDGESAAPAIRKIISFGVSKASLERISLESFSLWRIFFVYSEPGTYILAAGSCSLTRLKHSFWNNNLGVIWSTVAQTLTLFTLGGKLNQKLLHSANSFYGGPRNSWVSVECAPQACVRRQHPAGGLGKDFSFCTRLCLLSRAQEPITQGSNRLNCIPSHPSC